MAIQTPDWVKHAVFYQIFPGSLRPQSAQHASTGHSVAAVG